MLHIYTKSEAEQGILDREAVGIGAESADVEAKVSKIIGEVRSGGDEALRKLSASFDGAAPDRMVIPKSDLEVAFHALDEKIRRTLEVSAKRVKLFHEKQAQQIKSWTTDELGGTVGQTVSAMDRVGVYVPGGSAPLVSSAIMSALPAKVAGVREIVICTPPNASPVMLGAAYLSEADEVVQIGGAQAIAALAFGSESVRPVDKIVGAGNRFVTAAKRQVFGTVGIDGLAGPTETIVIADDSAKPEWVAADLLAQAEHDPLASAILITTSRAVAEAVGKAIEALLPKLSRAEIIRESLDRNGGAVLAASVEEAIALSDRYAPEHLCLAVQDAERYAKQVRHAGGVFVGEYSCEVLGDYVAGPSHVMPTSRTARFSSPLNVLDFIKITSYIALDESTSRSIAKEAESIANLETLTAHAAAAACRQ